MPAATKTAQHKSNVRCGLGVKPATGAFRMQTPLGLEPIPNYWEIVSEDYPTSGFSISGYIHDDDARILAAAPDLVEALDALGEAIAEADELDDPAIFAGMAKARAALAKAGV